MSKSQTHKHPRIGDEKPDWAPEAAATRSEKLKWINRNPQGKTHLLIVDLQLPGTSKTEASISSDLKLDWL